MCFTAWVRLRQKAGDRRQSVVLPLAVSSCFLSLLAKELCMFRQWLMRVALILGLCLAACQPVALAPATPVAPAQTGSSTAPTANLTDDCVTTYDAAVDYFPEK